MKKYTKPELKKIELLKNLHGLALSCCSKKGGTSQVGG